jgi:hypothetical protein
MKKYFVIQQESALDPGIRTELFPTGRCRRIVDWFGERDEVEVRSKYLWFFYRTSWIRRKNLRTIDAVEEYYECKEYAANE